MQVWYNRFLQYWNGGYVDMTRPSLLTWRQGELEHHTSKARYRRTDQKQFVKQMTGIECCKVQIRHICNVNKLSPLSAMVQETVATTPDAHFHIGQSQNSPENLVNSLCKHSDDPATSGNLQKFWLSEKSWCSDTVCLILSDQSDALQLFVCFYEQLWGWNINESDGPECLIIATTAFLDSC